MKAQLLGAALLAAIVLAQAQPASAHGGDGGASSDYRIEVTGFDGDPSGIDLRPVELGDRMELVRTTAEDVQILGYEGEPYIRLDASGIYENVNSPAHYINLDRFARQPTPASASAEAEPSWSKLSSGTSVRWHDHRTHWMDLTPREDVRRQPDVERVIFPANRVELLVDGRPTAAIVKVTWLPPPSRMTWLLITSLVGCLLLAALVLIPSVRGLAPMFAWLSGVAVVVGSGSSLMRVIVGAVAVALCLAGWVLKNRWLPVAAASIVVVLAVSHFEVFEHQLLAGWAHAVVQRVAITLALALSAAVVGNELVAGLGATKAVEPAVVEL